MEGGILFDFRRLQALEVWRAALGGRQSFNFGGASDHFKRGEPRAEEDSPFNFRRLQALEVWRAALGGRQSFNFGALQIISSLAGHGWKKAVF